MAESTQVADHRDRLNGVVLPFGAPRGGRGVVHRAIEREINLTSHSSRLTRAPVRPSSCSRVDPTRSWQSRSSGPPASRTSVVGQNSASARLKSPSLTSSGAHGEPVTGSRVWPCPSLVPSVEPRHPAGETSESRDRRRRASSAALSRAIFQCRSRSARQRPYRRSRGGGPIDRQAFRSAVGRGKPLDAAPVRTDKLRHAVDHRYRLREIMCSNCRGRQRFGSFNLSWTAPNQRRIDGLVGLVEVPAGPFHPSCSVRDYRRRDAVAEALPRIAVGRRPVRADSTARPSGCRTPTATRRRPRT